MSKLQTQLINFQNTNLPTARDEHGIIYVALKPIVEGMGLSWASQVQKIKKDARYVVNDIPYQTLGGTQEMLSLVADHLPAFLYSINPNRVRKDLRETIIAFQSETFSVINAYWRNPTLEPQPQVEIDDGKDHKKVVAGYIGKLAVVQNENERLRCELVLQKSKTLLELEAIPVPNEDGVIPIFRERLEALATRIERELGTVGKPYTLEIRSLAVSKNIAETYAKGFKYDDLMREKITIQNIYTHPNLKSS